MTLKAGVFLCRCSDNIASKIDVETLRAELALDRDVAFVETHSLFCSPDGQTFLEEKLQNSDVSHVVVAACSPRDHEITFQKCLTRCGKNKFLLQMANIREQCTWVTSDRQGAYAKSKVLTLAAVRRVLLHERLREKEIDCNPDVVVIGGGIAGMEAALLAGGDGRKVTLLERGPSVGGMLARLEEVAPSMECAPCLLSPRISELEERENIEVITQCDVESIVGYLGNFEIRVQERPRMVRMDACLGCDECIQVCPVEVSSQFDFGLSSRRAVDVPFPGCLPGCAVVDVSACLRTTGGECNACAEACPVDAMDFSQTTRTRTIRCGAIVVATGATELNPGELPQFGCGAGAEVYTLGQFARLTSNHGPTRGRIVKRDGSVPSKIAFIHCVGRKTLGYCSSGCCEAALGMSLVAQKQLLETQVVHLVQDVVCPGELGANLLHRVQSLHEGRVHDRALMIRVADVSAVTVLSSGTEHGKPGTEQEIWGTEQGAALAIQCPDEGWEGPLAVDMVVLVTGTKPAEESVDLLRQLDLVTTDAGFAAVDHPVLRGAKSSLEGVWVAGSVAGGRGMAQSVMSAKAAVGGVLSTLVRGRKLSLKSIVAHAASDRCSGCGLCVRVCPFAALKIDSARKVAVVNEVLCQGCGSCVATCPSGAALARHFTDAQLEAEIREVLRD